MNRNDKEIVESDEKSTIKSPNNKKDEINSKITCKKDKKSKCDNKKTTLPDTFVFEPTSGLYYDKKSGYYYNAEYGLYYDGNIGCYYKYNQTNNKYEIYSQNEIQTQKDSILITTATKNEQNGDTNTELQTNEKNENNINIGKTIEDDDDDIEEGEILNSNEASETEDKHKNTNTASFINEIREAAESAQISNGFIYEPISGMYYDQKSGYYYNAECGLYYNGNTGSYYTLNLNTNEFELYFKNETDENDDENKIKYSGKRKKYYINNCIDINEDNGMLSLQFSSFDNTFHYSDLIDNYRNNRNNDSYDEFSDDDNNKCDETALNYSEDISENYPPSLRLIVQETNLTDLRIGMLFIITFKGGTLGREGDSHDVLIPDKNVSKYHLKFSYNDCKKIYECIDLGSRNGTILNNKRMSSAKQESEPFEIKHDGIIQVAQTKLLCHIHKGSRTCNNCEPGLVMEKSNVNTVSTLLNHKEQLQKLRKRYGLNVKELKSHDSHNYVDRAAVRRSTIGSSNEYEKTQAASTETELSNSNKGFKMLEKMGWKKGQTLGKDDIGIKAPIDLIANEGTKGLGYENLCNNTLLNDNSKHYEKWKKAQDRYKKLPDA